jgi:hypothetical protein
MLSIAEGIIHMDGQGAQDEKKFKFYLSNLKS